MQDAAMAAHGSPIDDLILGGGTKPVWAARPDGVKTPDELAQLQPTPGYMRLLKESVLQIWKALKAAVREELTRAEQAAKTIQEKLDRVPSIFPVGEELRQNLAHQLVDSPALGDKYL